VAAAPPPPAAAAAAAAAVADAADRPITSISASLTTAAGLFF
jgi:hypothetical protein